MTDAPNAASTMNMTNAMNTTNASTTMNMASTGDHDKLDGNEAQDTRDKSDKHREYEDGVAGVERDGRDKPGEHKRDYHYGDDRRSRCRHRDIARPGADAMAPE
eukprot:GEMP01089206.1.p2 GENE.GEMP01089206.1~~GEMP01089206.1.p2  ORF type:complete len:104 (+),score=26.90 GEMP01089206.1:536-847(+)